MSAMLPVAWKGTPFLGEVHRDFRPEGMTLLEIVRSLDVPHYFEAHGVVCINAEPVPREMWGRITPRPSRSEIVVTLHMPMPLRGGGAGSVLKIVAAVAIIAVAAIISGGALAPILGSAFASGGLGALGLSAAVSIGGALAIGALSAPPTLRPLASTTAGAALANSAGGSQSGTASLSGNVLSAGGPIPLVAGTHRLYPPFACEPLVEQQGINQTAEVLMVLAGPHALSELKIGDVLADDIDDLDYEFSTGLPGAPPPGMIGRYGKTVQLSLELSQHQVVGPESASELIDQSIPENSCPKWHRLVTRDSPDEIWIQAAFPQGTIDLSDLGNRYSTSFRLRMRKQGDVAWVNFPEVMYSSKGSEPRAVMFKVMLRGADGATPQPPKDGREEGFAYAFITVPTQTVASAPRSTGGWTADTQFGTAGTQAQDLLDDDDWASGTTNVQNIWLDNYEVKYWLGSVFTGGIYEIEIIQGALFPDTTWDETAYQDGGGSTIDYFGYHTSGGLFVTQSVFDRRYKCNVASIASVYNDPPLAQAGNAAIAVRVTNRAAGQISVLASAYVYDWDGAGWNTLITTSNPAPHFRAALAGPLVKKPLPDTLIDDDDLVDWRTHCNDMGYEVNAVLEGQHAADVLRMIAGCGYARPRQCETWGVMLDRDRSDDSIVQMFSFRNLRSLSWEKAFPTLPDGLRVRYDDTDLDYRENEIIIFDPARGTLGEALEDIRYDGLVTEADAETRALFDMAQARARNAFFTGEADWEQIVCRRGDLVGVQHDAIDHVAGSARIKSVQRSGGTVTGVTLDGSVPYDTTGFIHRTGWLTGSFIRVPKLGVAVRLDDGTVEIREATGDATNATVLTLAASIADASSDKVVAGQIVTTGKLYSEMRRMIVLDITPKADLEATLTFVDEASELFAYHADAVTFDGSNDYLTRGAGLTGAADSKLMTFSALVRIAGGNSRRLAAGGGTTIRFGGANNFFLMVGVNAAGTEILSINSSDLANDIWYHVLGSVDMSDTAKRHIYINDVADLATVTTYADDVIDFTMSDWGVGATSGGVDIFNGDLANLWFAPGIYMDLSLEVNRRKFIGADGKPAFMGRFGEKVMGGKPAIFLAGGVDTWNTNKGAGGGFTVHGALTEAASSPSDP